MSEQDPKGLNRRDMLKVGLVAGGAAMIGPGVVREVMAMSCHDSTVANPCGSAIETYPTSPLIGGRIVVNGLVSQVSKKPGDFDAFTDLLPIPKALPATSAFANPTTGSVQDSDGQVHQVGVTDPIVASYPGWNSNPMFYRIQLKVAEHRFTSKQVVPINQLGTVVRAPGQSTIGRKSLPASTIWGFNGQFPGPMINAEYGQPNLVRFENKLDITNGLSSQNFGAPDRAFLTHLHNGHTAPESDGNPFHKPCPYAPGQWVDNLYLNWSIGQDHEKQSFFWYHDHRMDHTGANVYKGLVGLYPIYDPAKDSGDERFGLRLPGKRINNADGTFNVDYDIPLAFYDCRLDDGVTRHQDFHLGCKEAHPEWWGKTFFKHYPNQGFVGDVFTVNGKACPVLYVKRRKYRFRMLDASVARQYKFKLMQGKVAAAPGQQGQYNFVDSNGLNTQGEQVMRFRQIATDGGLMPFPIDRDTIELWPAKRREVVVDFRYYQDGISPTKDGDVIYLANVAQMLSGRKQTQPGEQGFDPNYCVPVLKIVIQGNDAPLDDYSLMPALNEPLRELAPLPDLRNLPTRRFEFDRATVGGEFQWVINGRVFDPSRDEADPLGNNPIRRGRPELWTLVNAGGGWTHPVHMHMEEHRIISRNGQVPKGEDLSREDVVALEPGESVTFYRNFRTFTGKYVTHCHNLSHEDHAMMFGWEIKP
jgi:FtsP/CotA-like multicopper oxidase with cupredoxin domain